MVRLLQIKLLQIIRMENVRGMRLRWLGPLTLALALAIGAAVAVGSGGASARESGHGSATQSAGGTRLARVDMHVEMVSQGKDIEVNVALTQTQNDCQAPLNGGICLRYTIIEDERAVSAGYGVIPASDVRVTAQAIALRVDTRTTRGFTQVIGSGLMLSVTWQAGHVATEGRTPAGQTAASLARLQPPAMAEGNIGSFVIPTAGPDAREIATMLLQ